VLKVWNGIAAVVRIALLGKIDPNASEYAAVLQDSERSPR